MNFVIVLVLYNKTLEQSGVFPCLRELLNAEIPIICYDNSLDKQTLTISDKNLFYHHDAKNTGIAAAYNYALNFALNNNYNGLLLLDHDTKISWDYVKKLSSQNFNNNVAAIVPIIFASDHQISPLKADKYIDRNAKPVVPGCYMEHIMAINSGTMINVEFMKSIGGFDSSFPLDFLDHWLFFEIYQHHFQVVVLDEVIEHNLSVLDYSQVSHQRFLSILKSESQYYQLFDSNLLVKHRRQLLKRAIKLFIKVHDSFYWRQCLNEYRNLRG